MNVNWKTIALFGVVVVMFLVTGQMQSWNVALGIFNMGLISAIMALGVNMQWGYAGLFSTGVMGFTALGGLSAVIFAMPPVRDTWAAGGPAMMLALLVGLASIAGAAVIFRLMPAGRLRGGAMIAWLVGGFFLYRWFFDPAALAIEAITPASTGYLGGLGIPYAFGTPAPGQLFGWYQLGVVLTWPLGGVLAAAVAWVIGKTALGLRSDYLAIATLGIAEIITAVMKNEDWLARGPKNVTGILRPVPYEVDLQANAGFIDWAAAWGFDPASASSIIVKLCYAGIFMIVLLALIWLSEKAWHSPWGRMMRAIRDNEVSAAAMGKNVTRRHLHVFIIGSAVIGLAGAMMTTLDGQLTPGTYSPLRYTFLIWVMVIVGGSGNNWGSVLGAFLIWFLWVQVEPVGVWAMGLVTDGMADGALKSRLVESTAHMRLLTMGVVLLMVLRFSPRGLIPEK